MTNSNLQKSKINLKRLTPIFFFILISLFILLSTSVSAQTVSLSVSPPVLEAVIKPGENIEQTYRLKNDGDDTLIFPDIYSFSQADEFGNAKLQKSLSEYDPLNTKYWFKIKNPQINLGQSFPLKRGEEKEITLVINPPDNTEDGDYYFTLIFRTSLENVFITPESKSTLSQTEIGSNILLTISKDGIINRKAAIKEFKAPTIIDSFKKLNYEIKIANIGQGFFKPLGKITVKSVLGKSYTLNLAPQNIITASSREITCLENEKLVPCTVPAKFLIGPYQANLSFQIEGDKKSYEKTITSFGLPSMVILIILVTVILIILLKKLRLHPLKK